MSPQSGLPPSSRRTKVRQLPQRGLYDRESIDPILDEALICHVGIVDDQRPFVMPMIHARSGDRLILHGAVGSRLFRRLSEGASACVTVTLLDGLVLARSAFHHSVNYRSVVILGQAEPLHDPEQKLAALEALVEHVVPGRWSDSRPPSRKELDATAVVAFPLSECSAKVRMGPPKDDEADHTLPIWAGVLPMALATGVPVPDSRNLPEVMLPDYLRRYRRPSSGS